MNTEESFDSLVAELMRKGYSKEYATKIAGKVAKEKGKIGHHECRLSATEAADVLGILIDKLHRKDDDATQEKA